MQWREFREVCLTVLSKTRMTPLGRFFNIFHAPAHRYFPPRAAFGLDDSDVAIKVALISN